MQRKALYFTAPERVALRVEPLERPGPGQVRVAALLSAISAGTEMLVYRGLIPEAIAVDATIAALGGQFAYPLKYGYASVGRVSETGPGVDRAWNDRLVFSFHPHESHYNAGLEALIPVPEGVAVDEAIFLPNMETAVNFVMDGRPLIGEFAAVFGLGVVGLLTTALLADFPLAGLVCFDRYPRRRALALELGATCALDPQEPDAIARALDGLRAQGMADGFDLACELSGAPAALDQAIALSGFAGRVVIGSWYGKKVVSLDLGGAFHRSRLRLVSSQVSTIAPELLGRWDKARRLRVAWAQLRRIHPARWITQRVPFTEADAAYRLLAERPEETVQVVLDYRA